MVVSQYRIFKLSDAFISNFEGKQPNWGPVGYIVYKRTYSRKLPNGKTEEFWQTLRRVVEGVFNIQKEHCFRLGLKWDNAKSQKTAQEMYTAMWDFKFLPAGRMLWMVGTDFLINKTGMGAFNCGAVSTADIDRVGARPFSFIMDGLMLGVGMGFDTKGEGKLVIQEPQDSDSTYVISDTREGWVDSVEILLNSFFFGGKLPKFDYSQIREEGLPIKGFGGVSSGPGPLIKLHENLTKLITPRIGEHITSSDIVDIENFISVCVISGNVRRSAAISIGRHDDIDFLELKHDQEKLYSHRYSSNNSIYAKKGMDYSVPAEHTKKQGEPGYIWLENIQTRGRFKDGHSPDAASLVNPCFTGDMKILTDNGYASFEDSVGDVVLSDEYGDHYTGNIWPSGDKEVIRLLVKNIDNEVEDVIKCTPDHVLITKNQEEIFAKDSLGKKLLSFSCGRNIEVLEITSLGKLPVYDFKINSPTSLGVVNGIVVHNCGEQPLESLELCCVTSDTRIQTKTGCPEIGSVVGKEVEIWNGESWSKVTPFVAGRNKEFYEVTISDGSKLKCTPDHKWVVVSKNNKKTIEKETVDLVLGDYIIPFSLGKIKGKKISDAYSLGAFAGDGYIEGPCPRVCLRESIPVDIAEHINNRELGFPDCIFEMDRESILEFVAGYVDADGSVHRNISSHGYHIFGSEKKMRDLQILLRRVGINYSALTVCGKKGERTNMGVQSRDLYCLCIPSFEGEEIPTRLKKSTVFATGETKNNAFPNGLQISNKPSQKIVSIKKLRRLETSYCFTEPIKNMGVFGNVLTKQCLCDSFPVKHDSLEEYKETLKLAYLFAKSITLINTHWPETNAIMLKNRRIGLSQSGVQQARVKLGTSELFRWCDEGYQYIQELDAKYSDWLCIPRSKRTTTIKPSGTVSLLPQVTPGIHYPESEFYIRRIRFEKNSPLLKELEKAGYPMEPDKYNKSSVVVEFPIRESYFSRTKKEVSMWEQLEFTAKYQHCWSDNAVSVTITFKPEEADDIKHALSLYEDRLKTASFLPLVEHGYEQAPYQPITEEEYNLRISKIKEFKADSIEEEGIGEKYCDGDSCTV